MRWFITKKHLVCLIGILVAAILLMLFTGCGWGREGNRPASCPGDGSTLVAIGNVFAWAGSAALGVGFLGRVACFVFPAIAVFAEFLGDIAVVGLASVLLGVAFIWVGTHTWLLALVVFLVCLGVGLRYRTRIARWLGFPRKPVAPKVDTHA